MLNKIVNNLLSANPIDDDWCISRETVLPFLDGRFKINFSDFFVEDYAITISHNSKLIGFKEFSGPSNVHKRYNDKYNPGFSTSFFGFESHMGHYFCSELKTIDAIFVKPGYRKNYEGIGKVILSVTFEVMKHILNESGKFRQNYPLFMAKECSTNIYTHHFQGRSATDYDGSNDIVVFSNVTYPEFDIKLRK